MPQFWPLWGEGWEGEGEGEDGIENPREANRPSDKGRGLLLPSPSLVTGEQGELGLVGGGEHRARTGPGS